jgi:hypothetical protein
MSRVAAAATATAAAALSLEIADEFSRVRLLRLAATFRRLDDARAVLGITDTARARTAGRQKQKLVRNSAETTRQCCATPSRSSLWSAS